MFRTFPMCLLHLSLFVIPRIKYKLQHCNHIFSRTVHRRIGDGVVLCKKSLARSAHSLIQFACKSFKNIPFALKCIEARNHKYLFFTFNTHKLHLLAEMKWILNNWWFICLFGECLFVGISIGQRGRLAVISMISLKLGEFQPEIFRTANNIAENQIFSTKISTAFSFAKVWIWCIQHKYSFHTALSFRH